MIDLGDIASTYDVSFHPKFKSGEATKEEILAEFMGQWDDSKDGKVSMAEWVDYYTDVSASIDEDDYFELMMRNAWHIAGGEGWCENTANRRVLVFHTNGTQTVEEIKDDLGLKADDIDGMIARLTA